MLPPALGHLQPVQQGAGDLFHPTGHHRQEGEVPPEALQEPGPGSG